MNVWTIICLVLAIFCLIIAIVFTVQKEKGATLISGFNTIPERQRKKYDTKRMVADMRNSIFLCFLVLILGTILSYFFNKYLGILALVIWIILMFRNVHFDAEEAFGKYRYKKDKGK